MRIIDAHLHVLDATWIPEGVRRAWARQGAGRTHPPRDPEELLPKVSRGQSDPTGDRTVAAFDRAGVESGVIPIVDWTIVGQPSREHLPIRELHAEHRSLAERWPGRLFHCAGIDPRHSDAAEILDEALRADSCVGAKLYPAAGWEAGDPSYDWLYERLVADLYPAVIHTSPLGGDPLRTPASRPSELIPILARHPDLPVVFAHAGFEAWWLEALDLAHGWRRTYLELSLWQHLAKRDIAEFRRRVAVIVGRLGPHRVLFGSDIIRGPRTDPDGEALVEWLELFCGLTEPYDGAPPVVSTDALELMLGGNAIQVFGLDGRRAGHE